MAQENRTGPIIVGITITTSPTTRGKGYNQGAVCSRFSPASNNSLVKVAATVVLTCLWVPRRVLPEATRQTRSC